MSLTLALTIHNKQNLSFLLLALAFSVIINKQKHRLCPRFCFRPPFRGEEERKKAESWVEGRKKEESWTETEGRTKTESWEETMEVDNRIFNKINGRIGHVWDEYYDDTGRLTDSKEEGQNPGQRQSPKFDRSWSPWEYHIYIFCLSRSWIFSTDDFPREPFLRKTKDNDEKILEEIRDHIFSNSLKEFFQNCGA